MKAVLEDGTAKSDWTKFSIPFKLLEGKSYDATKKILFSYCVFLKC